MNIGMNCSETRSHLPLFVGGDLDAGLTEAVEQHLDHCADCHAAHLAACEARHALRSAVEQTGPAPDLWPALRAQLAEQGSFESSPVERNTLESAARARRPWYVSIPMAAAAALLLLAAGALLGRQTRESAPDPIAEGGASPSGAGIDPTDPLRPTHVLPRTHVQPVALRPMEESQWPEAEPLPSEELEGSHGAGAVPASLRRFQPH